LMRGGMKADECWSALKNKCVLCNEPETSTSTDIIWRLKLRYCTGCMISNTMTKRDVDKGFGGNNSQLQDTGSAAKTQEKGKGTCQR